MPGDLHFVWDAFFEENMGVLHVGYVLTDGFWRCVISEKVDIGCLYGALLWV